MNCIFMLGLVRQAGWPPASFRSVCEPCHFSPYGCEIAVFPAEFVRKLRFPDSVINKIRCRFKAVLKPYPGF
jgi:hypothetical protein